MAEATRTKLPNVPFLDFCEENLKPGTKEWQQTCSDVRQALEEYGCFVVIYHRLCSDLDDRVFGALDELFALPSETKAKNHPGDLMVGYLSNIPHIPIHESTAIADATTPQGVQTFTDLMWPSGNHRFSETMLSYSKLAAEIEQVVDKMVFESYKVGESEYESHVSSTFYNLRLLRYRAPEMNESNVGADNHTDKTFVSVLHQNEVNGLEIQLKNGQWIPVHFPPGSNLVMAGDAYMAWSNGRIRSSLHRVVIGRESKKTRYSLALFSYNNGVTEIPEELVDEEHPLRFKPFDNVELVQFYLKDTHRHNEDTAKAFCGITAS